jgi:WD40 repeat protein
MPRALASPQEVDGVGAVAFGPDGTLASGGADGKVMLWKNLEQEKPTQLSLVGHKESVTGVKFSSDGKTLASASTDGTVIIRDLRNGGALTRAFEHPPSQKAAANNPFHNIQGLALSSDGKTLASQGPGGKVILWDMASGLPRRELIGTAAWDLSLGFTPDGKTVAAATPDAVMLWDVATGEPKAGPIKHVGAMDARSFSGDSRIVALKLPDHSVLLWDIVGKKATGTLSGHKAALTDLAFSSDGKILASGSADGTIIFWDIATQRPLKAATVEQKARVKHLTFSPDGKRLALAASQNLESTLTLWNLAGFERVDLLPRQRIMFDKLRFSPDGKVFVAAASKRGLFFWNVASRKSLGSPLSAHSESIAALAFSSDGDMLVSASDKGVATLWDVTRRSEIGSLVVGHSQGIRAAAFDNDAKIMVSSSLWGSKLIALDLDPASWARYACQVANRILTRNEWEQFVGAELAYAPACAQGSPRKE